MNRLTSETLPNAGNGSPVVTFTYDNLGRKLTEVNPLSGTTAWAYNTNNQVTSITAPPQTSGGTSPVTSFTYDADGRVSTVTNAMNQTTTLGYDADGHKTSVKDNLSDTTTSSYGHDGELLSTTDPLTHTVSYQYNDRLWVSSETNADGGVTAFTYDGAGNMLSLTDPDSNKTTFSYSSMNQVLTDTNALNNQQAYQYSLAGDLTQKTDRDGRVTEWTYDALRRVTSEAWMQGGSSIYTFNYAYNADNQVTSASNPDSSYAYAYNALGQQTSVDNSGTPNVPHVVLTSGYDLMGDRTSLSATIAGTADFVNNYAYDGDQDLTQITQQGQTGGNGVATKGVNYSYNLGGQVTSQVDYTQLGSNPPAIVSGAYSYDNAGRLTGIDYTHSTTTLDNMTWTLDAVGRVEDFTSSVDGTAAYSYDNANQLTGVNYTGNGEPENESYSFDSNGNRNMTGYTTGTNNQTTSDGTYNYTYDADGNRISRVQIANTQNSDYKTTYSYDYRNRLIDVYDYNNSGTLTAHFHYVYDVWDNLIGEEIDPTGGGTYTSSRWYVWDVGSQMPMAGQPSTVYGPAGPGGIALQFDGSGNLLVRYLDGPSPTVATDAAFADLAEEKINTQGSAGTVYFTALDNLGTLRDMIDTSGTVQDHLVYTAFGQIYAESNTSIGHWQDFAFQHLDANTGLAVDGHRWYDPLTGKWLSEDPTGFDARDPNLARYAGNDVSDTVDASGLFGTAASGGTSVDVKTSYFQMPGGGGGGVATVTNPGGNSTTMYLTGYQPPPKKLVPDPADTPEVVKKKIQQQQSVSPQRPQRKRVGLLNRVFTGRPGGAQVEGVTDPQTGETKAKVRGRRPVLKLFPRFRRQPYLQGTMDPGGRPSGVEGGVSVGGE